MDADARTEFVLNAIACAVVMLDGTGRIVLANDTAHRLFGYAPGELLGHHVEQLVPVAARATHSASRARFQQQPVARVMGQRQDLFAQRRDGSTFPAEIELRPVNTPEGVMVLATVLDATALRHAAERDSHLAAIVANSDDAIVSRDLAGVIRSWNHGAERIFGYSEPEALGRPGSFLLGQAQDPQHADADILRRVAAGETVSQQQARRVRKDGSSIDVSMTTSPLRSGSGAVVGAAEIARDVTELRRQETERQQHLVELEQLNKELDEFVYVASHDLRAPLRAVRSLVEWIHEDDPRLDAKTSERLNLIQSRVMRMTHLLDDILQYAQVRRNVAAAGPQVSAAALVADIAATLDVPAGLRIVIDPTLESVTVARMPLQQVLMNLIGNALKHHDRSDGNVTVAVVDVDGRRRFSVTDDGPGIPEQYRESVFEMFTVLKQREAVEGSGMGLAIVRKIVQQLGGRCGVEPGPQRGACFWFEWPGEATSGSTQSTTA